jgi:hypothetical protein
MQHEQAKTKVSCPACGFPVFNRRYPKCERCKSDLPASMLYSEEERRALLETESYRISSELKQPRPRQQLAKTCWWHWTSNASGSAVDTASSAGDGSISPVQDGFASGGGGVFDGGGASGSYGGDSGSSGGGG